MERGGEDHRNWAELLTEILSLVLQRLALLPDGLVFGHVCKSWRSLFLASTRPPPLLLLTSPSLTSTTLPIWVLQQGKLLKLGFRLDLLPKEEIVGSSMGWLLVVSPYKPRVHLINPLSNKRIRLPSVASGEIQIQSGWSSNACFLVKHVVMSAPPTSGDWILVAVGILGLSSYRGFLWCKPGDPEWSTFSWSVENEVDLKDIADIGFYDGKLYVLGAKGEVLTYAFNPHPKIIDAGSITRNDGTFIKWRLVHSNGEILSLVRQSHGNANTEDCIFKQREDNHWVRQEDLGGRALLKGHNGVAFVYTKDILGSGFEAGCIYYRLVGPRASLIKVSLPKRRRFQLISIPRESDDQPELSQKIEWIVPQAW